MILFVLLKIFIFFLILYSNEGFCLSVVYWFCGIAILYGMKFEFFKKRKQQKEEKEFPYKLNQKRKYTKYLLIFISDLVASVCGFFNLFFIPKFAVLILLSLYVASYFFIRFLVIDIFSEKKFGILYISIGFVLLDILSSFSNIFFPLYITQNVYKYNCLNFVTRHIHPVFFDIATVYLSLLIVEFIRKVSIKSEIKFITFFCVVLFSLSFSYISKWYFGYHPRKEDKIAKIGYVQKSVSLSLYMLSDSYPYFYNRISSNYVDALYSHTVLKEADLVVLPESSIPVSADNNTEYVKRIQRYSSINNVDILAHLFSKTNNQLGQKSTSTMFKPDGSVILYTKNHYVPIMESWLDCDDDNRVLVSSGGLKIKPLICFDSVFVKNYFDKSNDIDLRIVTSNDAFSEGTGLAERHELYTIMYAKFFEIPVFHLSQNHRSFYVDKKGLLFFLTRPFEKETGVVEIAL